jgi:hypothetical protein
MIICESYSVNADGSVKASLFADTKAEVVPGAEIMGLPQGVRMSLGSDVMTAAGEMAFRKSDGTWNWL